MSLTDIKKSDCADSEEDLHLNLKPLGWLPMTVMGLGFAALLGGLFVVGYIPHEQRKREAAEASVAIMDTRPIVATTQPYRAKAVPELVLPGSVRAFQATSLFPRANGYLRTQRVDIGDRVKEGQLLAEIDIPDVQAQLLSARANLASAQAAVSRAKESFELAQITYNRYRDISNRGAISQQELDERSTAYLQARNALEEANAAVKADQADIERLETLVGFSKVYAPFSGVVSRRNYDVGALLSGGNGTEMFRIEQTDVLRIVVDIPQAYVDQITLGGKVSFSVRNFPNRMFEGKVMRTSGAVDQTTRTVRVEADFPNPDGVLLPGMYGRVRFDLAQKEMPLLIPSSALIFGSSGMRVATVGPDNHLVFKKVTLGRDFGTEIEVLSGLAGSELVVSNPGERLAEGVEVTVPGLTRPTAVAEGQSPKAMPIQR